MLNRYYQDSGKKKPPKKVDEVVNQLLIPPIEISSSRITSIPDEPNGSISNTTTNTKMGCLDTLARMEESSDDNILEGWGNSQPALVACSSRQNRLDGPSRSKRLSKNLMSVPKRPRGEYRHPVINAFKKSIITSPDNKTDAFVSKLSNKVRFDGGRQPKQRTKTEKENYEKRHGGSRFRTRDSSPNAVIETYSSSEKKSNRNQTEISRSQNQSRNTLTNVLHISDDSE